MSRHRRTRDVGEMSRHRRTRRVVRSPAATDARLSVSLGVDAFRLDRAVGRGARLRLGGECSRGSARGVVRAGKADASREGVDVAERVGRGCDGARADSTRTPRGATTTRRGPASPSPRRARRPGGLRAGFARLSSALSARRDGSCPSTARAPRACARAFSRLERGLGTPGSRTGDRPYAPPTTRAPKRALPLAAREDAEPGTDRDERKRRRTRATRTARARRKPRWVVVVVLVPVREPSAPRFSAQRSSSGAEFLVFRVHADFGSIAPSPSFASRLELQLAFSLLPSSFPPIGPLALGDGTRT